MQLTKVKRLRRKQRHKATLPLLEKNPVLVLGLDLPFIIVTSVSLRAAAAISLELLLIHMGVMAVALAVSRVLDDWLRPLVHVVSATLIMALVRLLLIRLFRGITDSLGMYIYLMAVNGMTLLESARVTSKSKIYPVMSRALMNALGFAAAMFLAALLREYFGYNTLWGILVPAPYKLPGMVLPFFGFILIGFLIAGTKFLNKKLLAFSIRERERREKRFSVVQEQ